MTSWFETLVLFALAVVIPYPRCNRGCGWAREPDAMFFQVRRLHECIFIFVLASVGYDSL